MPHIQTSQMELSVKQYFASEEQSSLVFLALQNYGHLIKSGTPRNLSFADFADAIAKHYYPEEPLNKAVVQTLRAVHEINPSALAGFPLALVRKYQTVLAATAGHDFAYAFLGPKTDIEVRQLGHQHYVVVKFGTTEPLAEFKSDDGNAARTSALMYAESLGKPWQDEKGVNIFDPSSSQCWSFYVT